MVATLNFREEVDVLSAMRDQYFYLQDLMEKHETARRPEDDQKLGRINILIRRQIPVSEWEPQECADFLLMACRLARAEVLTPKGGVDDGAMLKNVSRLSEVLCSIAALVDDRVSASALQQACALWTITQLARFDATIGLGDFANAAVAALEPVKLPQEDLLNQVRAQCVLQVSRWMGDGHDLSPIDSEIARTWCTELLSNPAFKGLLARAAEALGVAQVETEDGRPGPDAPLPSPSPKPRFFTIPESFDENSVHQEYKDCLFELQGLAYEEPSPLSPQTSSQIKNLRPTFDQTAFGQPFNYAAVNLWKAYWTRGQDDLLALITRIAQLLSNLEGGRGGSSQSVRPAAISPMIGAIDELTIVDWIVGILQETGRCPYTRLGIELRRRHGEVAKAWLAQTPLGQTLRLAAATGRVVIGGEPQREFASLPDFASEATGGMQVFVPAPIDNGPTSETGRDGRSWRSSGLHLWMNTQLPQLIQTCSLPVILEDAELACRFHGSEIQGARIRQGIIEAFAGECRRMERKGLIDERNTLLSDNELALRTIHQEFITKSKSIPPPIREDELDAWEYLYPTRNNSIELSEKDSQGHLVSLNGDAPLVVAVITADPGYLSVIRSGDEGALYDYIHDNLDRIRDLLLERLDARLSTDRLLKPEGSVTILNAGKSQTHPRFIEARQDIDAGEWADAARKLERLGRDVRGKSVQYCQNFRAYALARDGDLLGARSILEPLTDAGFKSPAAFWNLACCITNRDSEKDRLNVLARGLDIAPNSLLLSGAVALGILLWDARLAEWLPCLTLSEALLLSFYLDFESLSRQERDRVLLVLREYATKGEPGQLAPGGKQKLNFYNMRTHLNALRLQPKAAEFWLRCCEPLTRNTFAYWQLRGDFLNDQGRASEAAQAFEDELRCRLYALKQNWLGGNAPTTIRGRAQDMLRKCMRSAELDAIGQRIYNSLIDFSGPQREDILPTDRQVNERYGRGEEPPPPELLTILLVRAGASCMDKLHEAKHLPLVRTDLNNLAEDLRKDGRIAMAEALTELMLLWDQHADSHDVSTAEERRTVLHQAQASFAKLQGAAQRELTPEERGAAANVLAAAQRVNNKLAGTLDLLPEIVASAAIGSALVVDDTATGTAFAVRLSIPQGDVQIRVVQATATLAGDLVEFPLRDCLGEIETLISADQSVLLTFSLPDGFRIPDSAKVRIEAWYSFAGNDYRFVSDPIPLKRQDCPPLPETSPYIHGRPLKPEEIEGHFFGRQDEQQQVLHSVANGQQRLLYVEGIRRTGKTSLLNSVRQEIATNSLPLVPVFLDASSISRDQTAGQVLCNLLTSVASAPEVAAVGVVPPDKDFCQESPEAAYLQFVAQLAEQLPDSRVLAMLDEFQVMVEEGHAAEQKDLPLARGLIALLNLLHRFRGPDARLLWLFAGHRAKSEFRELVPGPLLWANLNPLRIDFLKPAAVHDILTTPLAGTSVVVPQETAVRVHALTRGHPEVVQEMAETILSRAVTERRWILTPADADAAARETKYNDDKFADTWYPVQELSKDQRLIVAAFINTVKTPGSRIEPARLFVNHELTERRREAIRGLVVRNILDDDGETIGIKAYVLDLWLRGALRRIDIEGEVNGSVAIFVDVPNVTFGSREPVLTNLETNLSDSGLPGRFRLETVLDLIERYARGLSPAPIAVRWAANYPPDSPAVSVCYNKDYLLAKVPEDFHRKGNDDEVLKERMRWVEQQYPSVSHFVLVTGDKDFRIVVENRLVNGKHVHVIGRERSLAEVYRSMAQEYPKRFHFRTVEELIEEEMGVDVQ